MSSTQRLETSIATKLQRIAQMARGSPQLVFTSVHHIIDLELLQEAHRRTRKDGAAGVDGVTAEAYATNLDENLRSLLERFRAGTYYAPPVRRVHIPKGSTGTQTRPIGVPSFEDKVLQRAVMMVMEAIYEQDFLDCSYGFRPGRSAHQLLEQLWRTLMDWSGGWVLEIDIKSYFDTIDRTQLRKILDQRVRDGVLRRTIDKWQHAGVLEGTELSYPEAGSVQGGVISPLLSNVFLHEVLDKWFNITIAPALKGRAKLYRFADDSIIVFSAERDAREVMGLLGERFKQYGLTLHPDKTRLIHFRPPGGDRPDSGSFDLLGFTHYWAKSQRGQWVVKRKTMHQRLTRALGSIKQWCQRNRHMDIKEQHAQLSAKLRGHYNYYGVTGNSRALSAFKYAVESIWRKWLNRRSQRGRMPWERFKLMLQKYSLPPAIAVHSVLRHAANP